MISPWFWLFLTCQLKGFLLTIIDYMPRMKLTNINASKRNYLHYFCAIFRRTLIWPVKSKDEIGHKWIFSTSGVKYCLHKSLSSPTTIKRNQPQSHFSLRIITENGCHARASTLKIWRNFLSAFFLATPHIFVYYYFRCMWKWYSISRGHSSTLKIAN